MQFGNQHYMPVIYISIVVFILFYLWVLRRRRIFLSRFADRSLLSSIAPSNSISMKVFKIFLIGIGVSLSLIALARPQWGFIWEEAKYTGIDILIAVDVSKSMLAADVKPNRLERTKFAIKDLVRKLNGDRIGLIAFAGTAFLQCPLTIDYNGFLLALDDLTVATIPRGGTAITAAIKEAMDIFKGPDKKYKVLIIVTDGDDLEGDALAAAKQAGEIGIKIYCVGVGSPGGDVIPVISDQGERVYVTDRSGQVVKSSLNEELLKNIAINTGGSYVRATQSEFGLVLLYDKIISKLEKRDIDAKMKKHSQDRFQYFLAVAVILLLIEPLIPERRGLPR